MYVMNYTLLPGGDRFHVDGVLYTIIVKSSKLVVMFMFVLQTSDSQNV